MDDVYLWGSPSSWPMKICGSDRKNLILVWSLKDINDNRMKELDQIDMIDTGTAIFSIPNTIIQSSQFNGSSISLYFFSN